MKVALVSLRPTPAAEAAGIPALTPELLAATGARYSRNNEGLASILERIDPANLDASVDSIFRMVDYGHQSIADMAPVALFIDGVSQWLAFHVWNLCQVVGGQESSTRYLRIAPDLLLPPDALGIPVPDQAAWRTVMDDCFAAYQCALAAWEDLAARRPDVMRIPGALLADASDAARKKVARLRRNYGFDRSRYFIPLASATNLMLVMSARGWVQLCQQLASHPLPEPRRLAEAVRGQLALVTPRLLRHATEKPSFRAGIAATLTAWSSAARVGLPANLAPGAPATDAPPTARLDVLAASGADGARFAADLAHHDNRYAWIGPHLWRTAVRFAWDAVALAEIRDLNRHRTGTRYCPLVPVGFYAATDQVPALPEATALPAMLAKVNEAGRAATAEAHRRLAAGDPTFVYWLPLGAQFAFEHTTTADKFIYEAELRTGTGSHFRYARHLHDALVLWFERYPETRGAILEGTAEPE